MYVAIEGFTDAQDGRHEYKPGDRYPRPGLEVAAQRVEELAGSGNRRGRPVIALAPGTAGMDDTPAEKARELAESLAAPEKPRRGRKKKAADAG